MHPWLILDGEQPLISISVEHHWYYIHCLECACTGPRKYRSGHLCCDELSSSPDELLLVNWASVLCSQHLKAPLSAAAGSVCIKTKWVEIQPSSIPWKPLDEIYQFHSLRCSLLPYRDLHFQNLNNSISQIFDSSPFFFPRIRPLVRNRSSTFHHEVGYQVN